MAERSVTGAARRMGVGQPAMSNALARLRDMFGDPLLTRTPSGMQPTGRALDLVEPVSRILAELREEIFATRTFQPEMEKRTFRVGVSDETEVALMQDVLRAVRVAAPGVQLIARSVEIRLGAELLAAGVIDLAVGYFPEMEGNLEVAKLYHESFVCLFDAEACGIAPPLSLDDYAELPHILVSLRGVVRAFRRVAACSGAEPGHHLHNAALPSRAVPAARLPRGCRLTAAPRPVLCRRSRSRDVPGAAGVKRLRYQHGMASADCVRPGAALVARCRC